MQYVSTRGSAPPPRIRRCNARGASPPTGGLYVPESWPSFSKADIAAMRGLSYVATRPSR